MMLTAKYQKNYLSPLLAISHVQMGRIWTMWHLQKRCSSSVENVTRMYRVVIFLLFFLKRASGDCSCKFQDGLYRPSRIDLHGNTV